MSDKMPLGQGPDGNPFKVLVIDDSMFIAKQISQILASEGFDIVGTAGDGEAGVKKYQDLHPDVDLAETRVVEAQVEVEGWPTQLFRIGKPLPTLETLDGNSTEEIHDQYPQQPEGTIGKY